MERTRTEPPSTLANDLRENPVAAVSFAAGLVAVATAVRGLTAFYGGEHSLMPVFSLGIAVLGVVAGIAGVLLARIRARRSGGVAVVALTLNAVVALVWAFVFLDLARQDL